MHASDIYYQPPEEGQARVVEVQAGLWQGPWRQPIGKTHFDAFESRRHGLNIRTLFLDSLSS